MIQVCAYSLIKTWLINTPWIWVPMPFPVHWLLNNVSGLASCTEQRGDKPMAAMVITVGDASEKPLQQRTSPSHWCRSVTTQHALQGRIYWQQNRAALCESVGELFTSTLLWKTLQELLRCGKETQMNFLTQSKHFLQKQRFFSCSVCHRICDAVNLTRKNLLFWFKVCSKSDFKQVRITKFEWSVRSGQC